MTPENDIERTKDEDLVYDILKKRCMRVGAAPVPEGSFRSILLMCSGWSLLPSLESNFDPKRAVEIIKSLIKKGYVREYTFEGLPSFVPIDYWRVILPPTYKDMPTDREY